MCYLALAGLHGSNTVLASNPLLAVWAADLISRLSEGGPEVAGWSGEQRGDYDVGRAPLSWLAQPLFSLWRFLLPVHTERGVQRTEREWAPPRLVSEATKKRSSGSPGSLHNKSADGTMRIFFPLFIKLTVWSDVGPQRVSGSHRVTELWVGPQLKCSCLCVCACVCVCQGNRVG